MKNYSQTSLVELFKAGKVPEESKQPRHIETVISNVFLFEKRVYKVYKNDNAFFNENFRDLASKDSRFSFTRKDFLWNNTLSPSIYLEVRGVSVTDNKLEFEEPTDIADELVVIMRLVNTDEMFFERLLRGEFSEDDAFDVGKQFAKHIQKVRTQTPGGNYYDIFADSIDDVRSWVNDIPEHKAELLEYCAFLEEFRKNNRAWYEGKLTDELAFSGDIHSHNALYTDGNLFLMDTYAPKEAWMVAHRLIGFYRLGADLWALGSKEIFEAYVRGYEEGSGEEIDRRLDTPFVLYAASIMVAYLYMLEKANPDMKEVAARYHAFARDFYRSLAV